MSKIPIEITRVIEEVNSYFENTKRKKQLEKFIIEIKEPGQKWNLTHFTNRSELIRLRNEINDSLGLKELAEKFNCTIDQAEKIQSYQATEKICSNCPQKDIICFECIHTCQSPLEQILFVALGNNKIESKLQVRIRKNGSFYEKEIPVERESILTIPDFFIITSKNNICVYADGHTYHERTESQALRDRNIDRELQNLGFICLRFTGKEIRENIQSVVDTIKRSIEQQTSIPSKSGR